MSAPRREERKRRVLPVSHETRAQGWAKVEQCRSNCRGRRERPPHSPIAGKLCAAAAVIFAAIVLRVWGVTPFTLLLAIIALSYPAVRLYGWWLSRRALAVLDEPATHTHGMTMNYAAPVYDFYCPLLGLGAEFRQETLRHADLQPGQQVLDVGCGTGVLIRLAARMVGDTGEAVGIDPSPAMLQVARRNASADGSRDGGVRAKQEARAEANCAMFKVAAIEALPFEAGRFDVVFSSCMLHHLPPDVKRAGLAEVYRVLKPGGRFVIVDVDRPATWWVWLIVWPLLFMPMTAVNLRGEIPSYLRAAGFEPVNAKGRWIKLLSFWVAAKPPAVP